MKYLLVLLPFMVTAQIQKINIDVLFSTSTKGNYDVEKVEEKLNKDYFSEHNIFVNLIYRGEVQTSTSESRNFSRYVPNTKGFKNIVMVIAPDNHIAYRDSIFTLGGFEKRTVTPYGYVSWFGENAIVVSDNHLHSTVIAHELGHIFTLKHSGRLEPFLMAAHSYSLYDKNFIFKIFDWQADKIKKNIALRNSFKSVEQYMQLDIQKVYYDPDYVEKHTKKRHNETH